MKRFPWWLSLTFLSMVLLTVSCTSPSEEQVIPTDAGETPADQETSGCVPASELCDLQDNDCDGVVDNVPPQSCDSGLPGICMNGTQECKNGVLGICVEIASAVDELCNGLDDNCNGQIDEDINKKIDSNNCGHCGNVCLDIEWCENGTCVDKTKLTSVGCLYLDRSGNRQPAGSNLKNFTSLGDYQGVVTERGTFLNVCNGDTYVSERCGISWPHDSGPGTTYYSRNGQCGDAECNDQTQYCCLETSYQGSCQGITLVNQTGTDCGLRTTETDCSSKNEGSNLYTCYEDAQAFSPAVNGCQKCGLTICKNANGKRAVVDGSCNQLDGEEWTDSGEKVSGPGC